MLLFVLGVASFYYEKDLLTIVDLVQCPIYVALVRPSGVLPPNITNVSSVNDTSEK